MTEPHPGSAGTRDLHVSVTLKGALAERFPKGRTELDLAGGTTVIELIEVLDLPRASYIFVINGAMADRAAPLRDGSHVQIHPPMAGGS